MRVAILTVSDRTFAGEREDRSGPALAEAVSERGWEVSKRAVVPDDEEAVRRALVRIADAGDTDVILTTGGTGLGPRDVTPEATLAVISTAVPGLPEAMRAASLEKTPHAMISRAVAGVRGECLIVNLPGSPKGALECFEVAAPALGHASELLRGRKPDR